VDALGLVPTNTNIIGHDLGAFAAYAYAAQFARQGDKLVMMDATVPGLGIWPMLLQSAETWHFGFYGRYAEAILEGRERIYLDRHWDEFAADAGAITDEMREFYASLYVRPGAVGRALSHFEAFEQDAHDNAAFAQKKLTIPVLGLGGEHSLGPMIADHVALLASSSQSEIIAGAGHWLLEENTEATIRAVREFLQ
ncbi:MAG: alpha/beta hydrolase, partial [Pseudomonadota bacterium]